MVEKISQEVKDEARKIAKGIQRPKQTKEQTKLIAQGIEKGIAEFKKQQKIVARERDKSRKKEKQAIENTKIEFPVSDSNFGFVQILPWVLLALSWAGFVALYVLNPQ